LSENGFIKKRGIVAKMFTQGENKGIKKRPRIKPRDAKGGSYKSQQGGKETDKH